MCSILLFFCKCADFTTFLATWREASEAAWLQELLLTIFQPAVRTGLQDRIFHTLQVSALWNCFAIIESIILQTSINHIKCVPCHSMCLFILRCCMQLLGMLWGTQCHAFKKRCVTLMETCRSLSMISLWRCCACGEIYNSYVCARESWGKKR